MAGTRKYTTADYAASQQQLGQDKEFDAYMRQIMSGFNATQVSEQKPEEPGFLRKRGDDLLAVGKGFVGVGEALANVAGADNPVSRGLGAVREQLGDWQSDYQQALREEHALKLREAEKNGTWKDEAGVAWNNFWENPVNYASEGIGSVMGAAPLRLIGAGAKLGGISARSAGQATYGAGIGVGAVKGSQFDEVYQYLRSQGASDEEARAAASEAQAYGAKNAGQHALGAGLGVVDLLTGGEASLLGGKQVGANWAKRAARRGTEELGVEGGQAFQEKTAGNLAAIGAGDVTRSPYAGATGQATLEALMGGGPGAAMGVVEGYQPTQQEIDAAQEKSRLEAQSKLAAEQQARQQEIADSIAQQQQYQQELENDHQAKLDFVQQFGWAFQGDAPLLPSEFAAGVKERTPKAQTYDDYVLANGPYQGGEDQWKKDNPKPKKPSVSALYDEYRKIWDTQQAEFSPLPETPIGYDGAQTSFDFGQPDLYNQVGPEMRNRVGTAAMNAADEQMSRMGLGNTNTTIPSGHLFDTGAAPLSTTESTFESGPDHIAYPHAAAQFSPDGTKPNDPRVGLGAMPREGMSESSVNRAMGVAKAVQSAGGEAALSTPANGQLQLDWTWAKGVLTDNFGDAYVKTLMAGNKSAAKPAAPKQTAKPEVSAEPAAPKQPSVKQAVRKEVDAALASGAITAEDHADLTNTIDQLTSSPTVVANKVRKELEERKQTKAVTNITDTKFSLAAVPGLSGQEKAVATALDTAKNSGDLEQLFSADGTLNATALATAAGLTHRNSSIIVQRTAEKIARSLGTTVEDIKAGLRSRGTQQRKVADATENLVGLSPELQAQSAEESDYLGTEESEASMGVISTVGGSQGEVAAKPASYTKNTWAEDTAEELKAAKAKLKGTPKGTKQWDTNNAEVERLAKQLKGIEARDKVNKAETQKANAAISVTQEEATAAAVARPDPVAERRKAEANAKHEAAIDAALMSPEAALAVEDWEDFTNGIAPVSSLSKDDAWAMLASHVEFKNGYITEEELLNEWGEIEQRTKAGFLGDGSGQRGADPAGLASESEAATTEQKDLPPAKPEDGETAGQRTGEAQAAEGVVSDKAGFGSGKMESVAEETAGDRLAAETKRWSEVVRAFLSGVLDTSTPPVFLSSTPASLQSLGLPDLPLRIGKHALDYTNWRLTKDQMEQLPREIAHPQAVYIHQGRDGLSLNFLTSFSNGSDRVIVALRPNQHVSAAGTAHFVVTVKNVGPHEVVGALRKGGAVYIGNKDAVVGMREAVDFAKKNKGREASELRATLARDYGLSDLPSRVMYPSDLVKMVSDGRAKFSTSAETKGQGATQLEAKLKKAFNAPYFFDRAVTVVQDENDAKLPAADRQSLSKTPGKVQGFYDTATKKVYLIAANIAPGKELAVLLHEVGVHMGMKNLLGQANYDKLIKQLQMWEIDALAGDTTQEAQLVTKARERVEKAKAKLAKHGETLTPEQEMEELLAYFVEEAVNAGVEPTAMGTSKIANWFRTLWAAVKAAVRKLGMNPDKLTAQNVVDLAAGAARMELNAAWHGTAADFRKFDHSYMGSGEGANPESRMFSIADATPTPTGAFAKVGEFVDAFLADPKTTLTEHKLGWMTLEQMADRTKIDSLKKYIATVHKMQAKSKDIVAEAAKIDHVWAKMDEKDAEKLGDVMVRSTLMEFDPTKDTANTSDKVKLKADLAAIPGGEAQYVAVRDFYSNILEQKRAILKDAAKKGGKLPVEVDRLLAQVKGPYFPLMRMGDWYAVMMSDEVKALENKKEDGVLSKAEEKRLAVLRKDPKHYMSKAFDRRSQATAFANQSGFVNTYVNKQEARTRELARELPDFAKIESYIGSEFDAATRSKMRDLMAEMYYDMLPNNSALKQNMSREGVHGATFGRREFARSSVGQAHLVSRLQHNSELNEAMQAVKADSRKDNVDARLVYNELQMRNAIIMDNEQSGPIVNALVNGSYFAHLGMSPAYWITNALQTPMITMPWLAARHGVMASKGALGTALLDVKDILKTSVRDKDGKLDWRFEFDWTKKFGEDTGEHALFKQLLERNKLDITIDNDMMAISEGRHSKLADWAKMANTPVRSIELINRGTTALAAFRLGMVKFEGNQQKAIDHAIKAVNDTQLDYSTLNSARHMQSVMGSKSLARVMMQFRKFQQGMVYLLASSAYDAVKGQSPGVKDEARRTLYGIFATTGLMAGSLGLPALGTAFFIANLIGKAFDDDDDPFDAETEYKNWIVSIFGKELGTVVLRGLPSVVGADMTKRVGMSDVLSPMPFYQGGNSGREVVGNAMASLGGAPVGTIADTIEGLMKIANGDVAKGAEKLIPLKLAQNAIRAYRYSDEGMTEKDGDVIRSADQFGAWDITLRGMGFSTIEETEYYEGNNAVNDRKYTAKDVRGKLVRKIADGDINLNSAEVVGFNKRNPGNIITFKTIRDHNKAKGKQQRTSYGVLKDKRTEDYMEEAAFAEEEETVD